MSASPSNYPPTEEVSVQEAAHRLGLSVKTIERRIKARTIEARKVGGRWLVSVACTDSQTDNPERSDLPTLPTPNIPALLSELATKTDVSELSGQVAELAARIESTSKDQADALASYRESVVQWKEATEAEIATLKEELAMARRPLWRRFFRRP
jgi:excisionase family DNA binding protein